MTVSAHTAKTKVTRHIPLNTEALDVLKTWKKVTGGKGYAFTNPATGKPLTTVKKSWNQIVKDAKIHDFRFHDLRHTAASYLAMNGATLAEIAEVLGHKTLAMVGRYSHLSEQHTASVVERMNEAIFGS